MNVFHFNKDGYGEGIYFDLHIPKQFFEKLYFLISVLPFIIRLETDNHHIWITKHGMRLK